MSVDWAARYGGDLQFTPSGDIVTLTDTVDSAPATLQRLQALVLTNARQFDERGVAVVRGDDLFNQDWGASLPASVGESNTADFALSIAARIRAAVSADSGIASSPAPTITVTQIAQNFYQIDVTAQTVAGVQITLTEQLEG